MMHGFKRLLTVSALAVMVVLLFAAPVAAGNLAQGSVTGIPEIDAALAATGLGIVVMLLVEIVKRLGWIPDGLAGKIAAAAGVLAYLVMMVLGIFGIDLASPESKVVIELLTVVAQLALTVISALGSYGLLRKGEILKPLPGRE